MSYLEEVMQERDRLRRENADLLELVEDAAKVIGDIRVRTNWEDVVLGGMWVAIANAKAVAEANRK